MIRFHGMNAHGNGNAHMLRIQTKILPLSPHGALTKTTERGDARVASVRSSLPSARVFQI